MHFFQALANEHGLQIFLLLTFIILNVFLAIQKKKKGYSFREWFARVCGSHVFITYAFLIVGFQKNNILHFKNWTMTLLIINQFLIALMFVTMSVSYLIREPARVPAVGWKEKFFPFLCAILPIVVNEIPAFSVDSIFFERLAIAPPRWAVTPFLLVGNFLNLWGLLYLRKSFSIMAEVREVVYHGPYRYVRHPLYVGQILATIGCWLQVPIAANTFLLILFIVLQRHRSKLEEEKIAISSPDYRLYQQKTGAFLPKF